MHPNSFTLNAQTFYFSESSSWKSDSEAENQTLDFIRAWLSGQSEFTLQTSGSTGLPKSILVTREQMKASARMTVDFLSLSEGDSAFICLNTAFIGGRMMIVRSLEHGLQMCIVNPSANPFKDLDQNAHFDFVALVPTQMQSILSDGMANRLHGMKAIIIGGGAVSYSLRNQVKAIDSPVFSTYGMTETVSHIALQRLNSPWRREDYKVFDGVKIGQDERGCLNIQSVLTQHQLIQTNDVVEMTSENSFIWFGRADNVLNSGGYKIHLELLESELEKLFFELNISNAFFTAGLEDDYWGQKLVLLIEGELAQNQLDDLKTSIGRNIIKYQQPKEIIFCTKFVLTPTSKINRHVTLESVKI